MPKDRESNFAEIGRANIPMYFTVGTGTSHTIPYSGWYQVIALGAGGSGGCIWGGSTYRAASGGGGGGYAEDTVWLDAGTVVDIRVGTGGAGVTGTSGVTAQGNTGGDTVVTARGLALVAKGGLAGAVVSGALFAAGGLGGRAFGGSINFSGGAGGDATTKTGGSFVVCTGGGAPGNRFNNGGDGGAMTMTAGSSTRASTGGGSIAGVNALDYLTQGTTVAREGAGCGGEDGDNRANFAISGAQAVNASSIDGVPRKGIQVSTSYHAGWGFESISDPFGSWTSGTPNFGGASDFPGTGSGIGAAYAGLFTTEGVVGGAFCGGSGFAGSEATSRYGAVAEFGGGSGGMVNLSTGVYTTARGGNGLVVIKRVPRPYVSDPTSKRVLSPQIATIINTSRTHQVFYDGWYRISVIGAGGSGGIAHGGSPTASGAGGGGYTEKVAWLAAGTSLDIAIGAGGAQVSVAAATTEAKSGADGGLTSVVGGGIHLYATGGKAGAASTVSGDASAGGAGGIGYGGDFNYNGGSGGSIAASSGSAKAAGGGASGCVHSNGGNGGTAAGSNPRSGGGGAVWGWNGGNGGTTTSGGGASTASNGFDQNITTYAPHQFQEGAQPSNSDTSATTVNGNHLFWNGSESGFQGAPGFATLSGRPLWVFHGQTTGNYADGRYTMTGAGGAGLVSAISTGSMFLLLGGQGGVGSTDPVTWGTAYLPVGSGAGGMATINNATLVYSSPGGKGLVVIERIG